MSTTRPGSLLKKQIKVRTFADWDDLKPGFLEADLVAHCGESAAGSFLHTLVLVDVATGWTECVALLRRSEADVIGALNSLRGRLPVPLLGRSHTRSVGRCGLLHWGPARTPGRPS